MLDRADLMLCLSRAFLPPPAGMSVADWGAPLLEDLEQLCESLALESARIRTALGRQIACGRSATQQSAGSADPWLVEYARLFLVPPVRVPLNAGLYLDGALGGGSVRMIGACYEVAGERPHQTFRDLPDHVAMQIEFVGRLLERAARGEADAAGMADEFVRTFVDGWAEPLERACERATPQVPAADVYAALAGLLRAAVGEGVVE
jgi:TorA maturation chaperone TorD